MKSRISIAVLALLLLAGCAVGPDFRTPEAPAVKKYTAAPVSAETVSAPSPAGHAQQFLPGKDIPAQWWTLLHSDALNNLIRHALVNNPTLSAAVATLQEARENVNALTGSALYPRVDAGVSASRQKISGAAFGQPNTNFSPFTLINASVNVSYALDFTGGARRELEALESQVEYQQFQLEGAYQTIAANIVTTAVQEAALRAQIGATEEIIAAEDKQLDLTRRRFELGAVARTDVLAQQVQVAQSRAVLPSLQQRLSQTRHRLAVLAGMLPSDALSMPKFELDSFQLPVALPLSLPSELVRQRPDIRASEALLHAACAGVGVATANLYPRLTLTGSIGSQATTADSLFKANTQVWSIGAGLLQPLFHGGELRAKRRSAIAAFDQARAHYRSTVLQAFQNVADVLRALQADAEALNAQAVAADAAQESLDLSQKQFRLGAVSYLSLLNAERQSAQTKIALVQAQAARFSDTAALFQALGGGWWNKAKNDRKEANKVR